jgi:hypothetical protein
LGRTGPFQAIILRFRFGAWMIYIKFGVNSGLSHAIPAALFESARQLAGRNIV